MPELPEVEVLARHLRPRIRGQTIHAVNVRRAKVLRPTPPRVFHRMLRGAKFTGLERRGKYLLFQLRRKSDGTPFALLGHLGMTGRIFVTRKDWQLPIPRLTGRKLYHRTGSVRRWRPDNVSVQN